MLIIFIFKKLIRVNNLNNLLKSINFNLENLNMY